MKAALFVILGTVAGMALAFVCAIAVEGYSAVVHPIPADFDGSMDQMCAHVARYPHWVLATVVPLWAGTAFAAARVARMIGRVVASLLVATMLFIAVAANVAMLPYPAWFKIVCVAAVFAALYGAVGPLRSPPITSAP